MGFALMLYVNRRRDFLVGPLLSLQVSKSINRCGRGIEGMLVCPVHLFKRELGDLERVLWKEEEVKVKVGEGTETYC